MLDGGIDDLAEAGSGVQRASAPSAAAISQAGPLGITENLILGRQNGLLASQDDRPDEHRHQEEDDDRREPGAII